MKEPRDLVAQIEAQASLPEGTKERFLGYSVLGLPFASGHVLALRRFAASSIGPAYASVWHRDPEGDWTFYQNVLPQQGCSRYFGRLVKESILQEISIEWTGPRSFTVSTEGERPLEWQLSVRPTIATSLMNALGACVPRSWWQSPRVLSAMSTVARFGLGTGKLRLVGRTPNGQTFAANPRTIWSICDSRAVVCGEEAGEPGPLPVQAELGEFLIPQRGLFAIGSAFLENFDSDRHLAATSMAQVDQPAVLQAGERR
jgi:hypothetical protein